MPTFTKKTTDKTTNKTIYKLNVQDLDQNNVITKEVNGTIKELIIYFSNSLYQGSIKNKAINVNPKNISSLVQNVNLSYKERKDTFFRKVQIV